MDSKKGRKQSEDAKTNQEKDGNGFGKQPRIAERMFSSVDREILKQCEINSLVYACLPFMTFNSVVYRRYMIRNARNPTVFGYFVVSAFGYFMGRLAYFPFCQKRIADSPSMSPFAQLTREMIGYDQRDKISKKKKKKAVFDEEFKEDVKKDDSSNGKSDVEVTYDELREQNRREKEKPE